MDNFRHLGLSGLREQLLEIRTMKTLFFPSRVLFVATITAVASLHAQLNPTPPVLGLPRLKAATPSGDAALVAASEFSVDELAIMGVAGATKGNEKNVDYLSLDSGKEWARPLRGPRQRIAFVSLLALGSQSTVIEIGGARLGFTASLVEDGLQLMYDDASGAEPLWRPLGIYLPLEKHDGRILAAAPLLTVQIEPELGVWHLFAGTRLLAYGLPLLPSPDANVRIKSGNEGALVCGLAQSDQNPLFVDINANGVDDAFEKEALGGLLPSNNSMAQRKATVQAWKAAQKNKPSTALSYARLSPD